MMKEEKFLFFRIFAVIAVIFFVNIGTFMYKYNVKVVGITGHSIKSDMANLYTSMPLTSKVFLIVQWGLLVVILLYAAFRDKGTAKRKKELSGINIKKNKKDSKTDLDVLYDILKQKKELNIFTIEKTFGINKKLVLEWAKILESGNLAYLDYPRFGGIVLKLKLSKKELAEKKKEEEMKKGKKGKIQKKELNKNKKPKLDRKTKREMRKFEKNARKAERKLKKQIKKKKT